MLKTFKKKILLLQISLISLVFLAALISIFTIFSHEQEKLIDKSMESIVSQATSSIQGSLPDPKENTQSNEISSFESSAVVEDSNNIFFNAKLNKDRTIKEMLAPFIKKNNYKKIVAAVKKDGHNKGKVVVNGHTWKYQISNASKPNFSNENGQIAVSTEVDHNSLMLSCLDITANQELIKKTGLLFLYVGIVALLLILALSFYFTNLFFKPVKKTWESQQRFIADASHELKTPVSIINANVDVLLSEPENTIVSQEKWINNILHGTKRMEKLIERMLKLSRIESGELPIQNKEVNLSKILESEIDQMAAIITKKELQIDNQINSTVTVNTDEDLVQQIFQALLENAVKYTPKGGLIKLILNKSANGASFIVKNSGSPISSKDLSSLFERFYRVDQSREGKSNSFGMGLAIAKACADKLNGKLSAENGSDGLVTFIFEI
ncbi:sensor histidine kinase [Xylocopilactobacillus apis]|uniref:histidine kinase n=1 Tax=Xylocopilactobacillus apis TaxID=2932183 RepID=A0AAU9D8D9_9LACO|nr:HAMP domain-containing sensor histidine kinase [Xylocopilactobacillus apis]BDR55935.1 histidine kinase [Xylocopilactobacillus apis]